MNINNKYFKNINTDHTIDRKRISEKIDNSIVLNKIIYIYAPIGWGKTIAASYYVNKFLNDVTWYDFNEEDNNRRTLRYFLEERRKNNNNLKRIIIFDNFDLIEDKAILEGISNFVDTSPKNYRFIFLSRRKIPSCFSKFMVQNKISIINKEDLVFSKKEVSEFYLKNGINVKESDITKILLHTGGWPICINIGLINLKLDKNEDIDELFKNNVYINDFITRSIWNRCSTDAKNIFIMASLFEKITLEQCIEITGEKRSKEFLNALMSIDKDKYYRFNPIILQFIKGKYNEINCENFIEVYKKAGRWFEKKGLYLEAADAYFKAGDIKNEAINLEKFCDEASIVDNFSLIKKYIMRLPEGIVNKNTTLCSVMAIFEIIYYNPNEGEIWYRRLLDIKNNLLLEKRRTKSIQESLKYDKIIKKINGKLIYVCVALPQVSNKDLILMFYNMYRRGSNNNKILKNISLTGNFPSILRGIRDVSDIWNEYDTVKSKINLILGKVLGSYSIGLANFASAEVDYERNYLNQALMKFTKQIIKCNDSAHVDILFIAYILLEKTMCASGYIRDAKVTLHNIEKIIKNRDALYLMNNLKATYTRLYLLIGEIDKAQEWLNDYYERKERKFVFLDMYEYLTKARIYIATKEYKKANSFLEILYILNKNYNCTINIAECCVLQAIALNRENEEEEAFKKIEEAIEICKPHKYIRIFADEGEAFYDVLNKYCKNTKIDNDIKKGYLMQVLSEARKFGEMYPDYLRKHKNISNIYLTKSEITVLKLINKGLSNIEISDYLNIKKDTVKFHTKNIYSKLGVKNRLQAVQFAKKNGII